MTPRAADRSGDLYVNLVLLLLLLPNLNLLFFWEIGFYNQPILPLALIGATTLARLTLGARFTVNGPLLFAGTVAVLLVAYLPALMQSTSATRWLTAAGYLAGPVAFLVLYNRAAGIALAPVASVLGMQWVTCAGQLAGIYGGLGPVTDVLQTVFVGFKTETLGGGRGCSGTYGEPSHLARYAIAILALTVVVGWQRGLGRTTHWSLAGLSALLVIATLSATGLALLVATAASAAGFAFIKRATPIQRVVLGAAGGGGAIAGALVLLLVNLNLGAQQTGPSTVRMFDLVRQASAVATKVEQIDFYDLQRFGGYRLINVYVGYASIGPHPLGQGPASYFETFQRTAAEVGVDLRKIAIWTSERIERRERPPVKPNSYGAQLTYDFGILGLLAVAGLGLFVTARMFARPVGTALAAFAVVGLLQILIYSTTTIMAPWILMGLLASVRHRTVGDRPDAIPPNAHARGGATT